MKKALLGAFFISLISCHSNGRWKAEKVEAVLPNECSRIYWPIENRFTDVELDIYKLEQGPTVFLTLYGLPLTAKENKNVQLEITVDEQKKILTGYLFEGGHRIALSNEDGSAIMNYLQDGKSVGIKLHQYSSLISPEGFLQQYQQLY